MRLFQFEVIKLGKKTVFLTLSVLLIAANLMTLYTVERHTPAFFYVFEQGDNYRLFLEGDESADIDGYYSYDRQTQESYRDSYAVFVGEMSERVKEMGQTSFYGDQNSFVYRNLIKTQNDFASFSGTVLAEDNCFGIRELAGYNGGLLFTLVFIAVLTYYVLFMERSLNLTLLLKGCRRGHTPLAIAKLSAMLVAVITYILMQETLNILLLGWMYGYGDLGRAIQSISIFRNCAYHLTVGGALVSIMAVRAAIGVVLVCALFCIGMIFKSEKTAVIISGVVLCGEYLLECSLEISGSLSGVKCVNPFYCWNMQQVLGEYLNLNLFGYPVGKDICALATAILVVIFLPVVGCIVFSRTYQIKVEGWPERGMQWLRARTSFFGRRLSVFYYEVYKVLFQQKKGIVLVLFLVWGVNEAAGVFSPSYYASAEEAAYHHYISLVQGPVTEKTFSFFEEEAERLDELRSESSELAKSGSLEDSLLSQVIQSEIAMLEDGFHAARMQLDALLEMSGDIWDKFMIDERAYEGIWQDIDTDISLWFVGAFFVLYLVSGIYPMDEKKKMMPLLRTTRGGQKKLNRSKNCCAILFVGLIYFITELPLFLRYWKIDNFVSVTQRLCDFTDGIFSSTCPLWLMIASVFTLKALSFLAVGVMGVRLSKLAKNGVVTFLIGIGAVGMISMILYRLGWNINMMFINLL